MKELKQHLVERWGIDQYQFLLFLSKHQLEDYKKDVQRMINAKYPKRNGRLLGTRSKALPEDDFERLIEYVRFVDVKMYVLLLVLGYCGMRVSDGVVLRRESVDFARNEITVFNSKSQRSYHLPLNDFIIDELRMYCDKFSAEIERFDGYLFFPNDFIHHPTSKHLTSQFVNRKIKKYLDELGLQVVYSRSSDGRKLHLFTTHSLRGRAGSNIWKKSKHDVRMVQRLLDHSPRTNSSIYLSQSEEEFEKLMRE